MVYELLTLIGSPAPQWVRVASLMALGVMALGGFIWARGGKYTQTLTTLTLVAIGTLVGMSLPKIFMWNVSGMGPGVGGAIVLGLAGYIFYRFWVAMGLGLVSALWVGLGVWVMMGPGRQWSWPAGGTGTMWGVMWETASAGWKTMPVEVTRVVPFACGMTLVAMMTAGLFWPKAGQVMFYALAGVTLMVGAALAEMKWNWLAGVAKLPGKMWVQVSLVGGLLLLGIVFQWLLVSGGGAGGGAGKKSDGKKPTGDAKGGGKEKPKDES